MMAIWQLESEKNDPRFSIMSPNLSFPQNHLYCYLKMKQKNKNNKQTAILLTLENMYTIIWLSLSETDQGLFIQQFSLNVKL